jgi:hypothetical protein
VVEHCITLTPVPGKPAKVVLGHARPVRDKIKIVPSSTTTAAVLSP